jgi:lipoprotein-anchoring transpeptidase ErfK/SrfK
MAGAASKRNLGCLLAALLLVGGAAACGSSGSSGSSGEGADQSVTIPATPVTDPVATGSGSSTDRSATSLSGASSDAGGTGAASPLSVKDEAVHVVGVPGRLWVWATVDRATVVRARPTTTARSVGTVQTTTPEGTAGNVQVLATQTLQGAGWAKVLFPSLPNGATGWIPRGSLGAIHLADTQLTIDREHLVATLRRAGKVVFTAPVGVGQAGTPTPTGSFFIRDQLAGFHGSPVYGPIAFGTSARSAVLTDWPAGGYIGIHGTNEPQLIPGRVSHGCVRFRNGDILRLARLMPVGSAVRII